MDARTPGVHADMNLFCRATICARSVSLPTTSLILRGISASATCPQKTFSEGEYSSAHPVHTKEFLPPGHVNNPQS